MTAVIDAHHRLWDPARADYPWLTGGRMLFGSDWPVCLLAASYEQVAASARSLIAQLPSGEQAAIMGATAVWVCGLG